MASDKQIVARFQQKHDIEANWKKALNFVPKAAEIIVYDPDGVYSRCRFKIGDGRRKVNELPFITDIQEIANLENELKNEIAAERARIDQFVSLEEGSTTGDAELIDIRTAYNGEVYENAGTSIRQQIQAVLDQLTAGLFSTVKTINGIAPDDSGNIELNFAPGGTGGGGGGGGGGSTYTVTLTNLSDSRMITVPKGVKVELKVKYSSVDEGGISDGPGIGQVLMSGVVKQSFTAEQDKEIPIDVTDILLSGTNNISIKVTNSEGTSRTLAYVITVAAISLTSSFDSSIVQTGPITFPYTPVGLSEKKVTFELDGRVIGEVITSYSGRQLQYTIPAQSHGAHTLRVWFTCKVEDKDIDSNILYYSIICEEVGNMSPIIAVTTPPVNRVEQYNTLIRKYRVYDPAGLKTRITLEVNKSVVADLEVDRNEQTWSYMPTQVGDLEQTIRCGETHVSWTQTVVESGIKVEAETEALALYLTSSGRSNNEDNPGVWENNEVPTIFQNFNFVTDGWLLDEDGNTVLRVTGDARLEIPYQIFGSSTDIRTTGKTLEFELATREVLDYDAEVLSCFSGGRGFVVTAQQLSFASGQSKLGTRYKEDEHIRISIVIERSSETRLLLCYINGILSGATQYPTTDGFNQATPVNITIGSSDCTTDLYNIRIYNNSLTRYQILDNWIADTQNYQDRIERYKRNKIYDAYDQIVISDLPKDLPYLVISGEQSPQFKGDKKTVSGTFTNPSQPDKNFSFTDAQIDVQGTSSADYYRKNYKVKFKNGIVLYNGQKYDTYQMNNGAIPTSTFTMKADVASSEGAFNVVLSMLYNEICPYKTPAQVQDARVRQCIEGFPCLIFWDYGNGPEFLGKYNFNNDKGTQEVFGFKEGDESWEIRQNGTDRVGWHSADFSGDAWKEDFEARFPEDNVDTTRLQQLAEWLVSTDTGQATNADITPVTYGGVEYTKDTKEYRLAKFSAELSNHFVEEAIIFYYLFTEIMLSIDQREKNAFPTYLSDIGKWIVLFYDADSSCGTDNKGNLAFDYYLEDIDYIADAPVYNGQNSVLWKNLRETRASQIEEMYRELRTSNKINYNVAINKFENHQSKWPEAIFNEDMYVKYIVPLTDKNAGTYLPMLQGKKEQWMKWWLYNRFRYLDSKYTTGTSQENNIQIRAKEKANITMSSYVNMYGHVKYNSAMVTHRMDRDKLYEFEWAASGAEDAVISIYDADMLTSLGDLSPLKPDLVDISKASHLTSIKIGDNTTGYDNPHLKTLAFGSNKLLRTIDARNCSGMGTGEQGAVDISGCVNVEHIYFEGTKVKGVTLPDGGIIKTLHLPETITDLTILNQQKITDFSMPKTAKPQTLRIENSSVSIDMVSIIMGMEDNQWVRLTNIDWNLNSYQVLAKLAKMKGMTETGTQTDLAVISGKAHFKTAMPITDYLIYSNLFPYLTITADSYTLDALEVSPDQIFVTANDEIMMLADGGHETTYTGAEVDEFISIRITAGAQGGNMNADV